MLKQYIERKNDDVTPEKDLKDQQAISCNTCSRVVGVEEELSVDDDQLPICHCSLHVFAVCYELML